jgi:hypothetical protein
MKKLLFLFFFMSLFCDVYGALDVETLPTLRTKQYPMGPYGKIMVFSAPRTGSSLIYNVFRFLFENEENLLHRHDEFHPAYSVLKTHRKRDAEKFQNENVLFIIPIRNPLHAGISTYRIRPTPIDDMEKFCKRTINRQVNHIALAEKMKQAGRNVLFIKYEDFEGNIDSIFDFIERELSLSISDMDKAIIKSGYSKENIYSCINTLPDFSKYLPISGFHGKHVILEKYTPPESLTYWLNHYLQMANPVFMNYGY